MQFIRLSGLLLLTALTVTAAAQPKALPSVEVRTLDGKPVDIKTLAVTGKPTVLSFWATWCAPCKKELDAIAEVYDTWQTEYGVQLLAVTIDDQRAFAKVAPMVASKRWPFTVLSDVNQQLKNALNFQSIPQTFLLDREGNIVYAHTGYVPGDELELEDQIKRVAGK